MRCSSPEARACSQDLAKESFHVSIMVRIAEARWSTSLV